MAAEELLTAEAASNVEHLLVWLQVEQAAEVLRAPRTEEQAQPVNSCCRRNRAAGGLPRCTCSAVQAQRTSGQSLAGCSQMIAIARPPNTAHTRTDTQHRSTIHLPCAPPDRQARRSRCQRRARTVLCLRYHQHGRGGGAGAWCSHSQLLRRRAAGDRRPSICPIPRGESLPAAPIAAPPGPKASAAPLTGAVVLLAVQEVPLAGRRRRVADHLRGCGRMSVIGRAASGAAPDQQKSSGTLPAPSFAFPSRPRAPP